MQQTPANFSIITLVRGGSFVQHGADGGCQRFPAIGLGQQADVAGGVPLRVDELS
jgi:hypothetical protein